MHSDIKSSMLEQIMIVCQDSGQSILSIWSLASLLRNCYSFLGRKLKLQMLNPVVFKHKFPPGEDTKSIGIHEQWELGNIMDRSSVFLAAVSYWNDKLLGSGRGGRYVEWDGFMRQILWNVVIFKYVSSKCQERCGTPKSIWIDEVFNQPFLGVCLSMYCPCRARWPLPCFM